jgi:type I restriction enzyme S subunit
MDNLPSPFPLPNGWVWRSLAQISDRVSVGYVGPTSDFFCAPGKGVPLIRSQNIRPGRLHFDDTAWVTQEFHEQNPKSQLKPGDVLITRVGANAGDVCLVPTGCGEIHLSSAVFARPKANFSRFVELWLRSPFGQQLLKATIVGSVSERINTRDAESIPVPVPPLSELQHIATTLGALDDKIDLNRRMNETLEAMARAIFKDWFVDFGPTRAKMEGRAAYFAPEIWALFPDRLDDEGKPEGWTNSTIGQEVDVVGGSTPSTKAPEFWGGDIAWATPKDLSALNTPVLLSTERKITNAGLSQIGSGLLPIGTVLLSSRAPIGYMAIAQIPTAVNQGFIAMVCRKRLSNVFVWLWTQANMAAVLQNANGSTFQEISKTNFRPIAVTVARPDVLRAFDETVGPMFNKIVSNDKESRSLVTARDLLLPKLMTGEIRVKEAEKKVQAVA